MCNKGLWYGLWLRKETYCRQVVVRIPVPVWIFFTLIFRGTKLVAGKYTKSGLGCSLFCLRKMWSGIFVEFSISKSFTVQLNFSPLSRWRIPNKREHIFNTLNKAARSLRAYSFVEVCSCCLGERLNLIFYAFLLLCHFKMSYLKP